MNNPSAVTLLLLQAIRLYEISFGLIPPLFAELELQQNEIVHLRYFNTGGNPFQKFWSCGIISLGFFFINICIYLLVKTFLQRTERNLNEVEIVLVIMCVLAYALCVAFIKVVSENQNAIPLLNDFIGNGFRIGKKFFLLSYFILQNYENYMQ